MPESVVYNCDCMDYMKTLPDNAFDLAVVDPPYGGGFTEGGGCQGWFSKHHQNTDSSQTVHVERERERDQAPRYNRFGSPGSIFEKYKRAASPSDSTGETDGTDTSQSKTTAKKLSRGTLPQGKNISKSFSASHAIKSFGAATISLCLRHAAF